MKRLVAVVALAGLALSSCSGGAGGYVGKWQSTFGGVTLNLLADNTAQISVVGITSDGTWEAEGKDKIVVHGPRQDLSLTHNKEGDLTDGLGGRFVRQP